MDRSAPASELEILMSVIAPIGYYPLSASSCSHDVPYLQLLYLHKLSVELSCLYGRGPSWAGQPGLPSQDPGSFLQGFHGTPSQETPNCSHVLKERTDTV